MQLGEIIARHNESFPAHGGVSASSGLDAVFRVFAGLSIAVILLFIVLSCFDNEPPPPHAYGDWPCPWVR